MNRLKWTTLGIVCMLFLLWRYVSPWVAIGVYITAAIYLCFVAGPRGLLNWRVWFFWVLGGFNERLAGWIFKGFL